VRAERARTADKMPQVGMRAALVLAGALVVSAYLPASVLAGRADGWVGWLSLLPLFAAIRLLRPARACLCGALWGASLFAWCALLGPAAFSLTLKTAMLLCTVPAAYGWLGARLTRWIGFSPFVLGVAWMGVELAAVPLGVSFGLSSAGDADPAWVSWLGHTLGTVFVAFVAAYASAAFVCVAARVALSLPRPQPFTVSTGPNRWFAPRTFFCFRRFAIEPCQPRPPPRMPAIAYA